MKPNLNLIAVGTLLAAATAGLGQPGITNQPQTQAVAPGESAVFAVGASGAEPLAYQWQRNFGTGFSNLPDRTNAALALSSVQSWDAWDYRVVAPSRRHTEPGHQIAPVPPAPADSCAGLLSA